MFTNGQLVVAADLNNFSVTSITTTGDITVGDDIAVTGDADITGSLTAPNLGDSVCGRLTLTTGLPVTTADVTAAGTLYYALYDGNQIGLYTGTAWKNFVIAQLSIAVPAVATQCYDVFVDYNSGTPILALVAWTSDTTRATALAYQNGRLVLSGTATKRYVGTVRTVSSGQLNDSYALRHVWNYYNRVDRPMRVVEATNTWTYTTATYRQANAAATNQLDFVCGVIEDGVEATVYGAFQQTDVNIQAGVAIGLNSTTTPDTNCLRDYIPNWGATRTMTPKATCRTFPIAGRNTLVWLEYSEAGTGTTTWLGDNGTTIVQTGIHGMFRG